MHVSLPQLATDIEAERRRSIPARRPEGSAARRGGLRRAAAILLARVSLASAGAVRRLDACIAEDLTRPRAVIDGI
jgi:hypothetical protein